MSQLFAELVIQHTSARPALIFDGRTLTQSALSSAVRELAHSLALLGVRPTDVVAIAMPNSIDLGVCLLGASLSSCALTMSPALTPEEANSLLSMSGAALLLVQDGDEPPFTLGEMRRCGATVYAARLGADDKCVLQLASGSYPLAATRPRDGGRGSQADDPTFLLFSTGTTGRAKGVARTHAMQIDITRRVARHYSLETHRVTASISPLFYSGALTLVLGELLTGGCVVMSVDASLWSDVDTHSVTNLFAVPARLQMLIKTLSSDRPSALRFIVTGGAQMGEAVHLALETALGVPVLTLYGASECGAIAGYAAPPHATPRRPGFVGPVIVGITVRVQQSDGQLAHAGHGEVCVDGPAVINTYLRCEDNGASFDGGVYHTGDTGQLLPDGMLRLTGRIKEMINRGGAKISHFEVEEALATHAAVHEVIAFAVPDAVFGEVVGVAVVYTADAARCQPSHAELVAHARLSISEYKLPVRVVPVKAIPMTGETGKVNRNTLHADLCVDLDSPAYHVVGSEAPGMGISDAGGDPGDSLSLLAGGNGEQLSALDRARAHANFACMVSRRIRTS
jgi:acyl-CoA synthetase (AMP-forming)/AMP-acid ligase II